MKKICFINSCIVSWLMIMALSPVIARADASSSPDVLILSVIDDICGDLWCEGDFDFQFQKVILNSEKNELQLFFKMSQIYPMALSQDEEVNFSAQVKQRSYDVSCIIPGYSFVDKILTPEKFLQHDFYLVLSSCIGALESKIILHDKLLR